MRKLYRSLKMNMVEYSLQIFTKSLKSMSDEWLDVICWSSLVLRIVMIKQCVAFSLIVLGTLR